MSSWSCFGEKIRREYENIFEPKTLLSELIRYKDVFADFELKDLLKIYDIQAKSEIAAAVIEMPEYLSHEIGQMRSAGEVDTVTRGLYDLSNSIERFSDYLSNSVNGISEEMRNSKE